MPLLRDVRRTALARLPGDPSEAVSQSKLFYKGSTDDHPVFQIDLEHLIYNRHNGRLETEMLTWQRQHSVGEDEYDNELHDQIEYFLWEFLSSDPTYPSRLEAAKARDSEWRHRMQGGLKANFRQAVTPMAPTLNPNRIRFNTAVGPSTGVYPASNVRGRPEPTDGAISRSPAMPFTHSAPATMCFRCQFAVQNRRVGALRHPRGGAANDDRA